MKAIDKLAEDLAYKFGMPAGLHIPIAARNMEAIEKYIGSITEVLSTSQSFKAFLVTVDDSQFINRKLAIWKVNGSEILHFTKQVWVHVDFSGYRRAYQKAFPDLDLNNLVIDHILNRRVARLKGLEYLRVIPISRAANSNSGTITEKYGFEYHNTENMKQLNNQILPFIQYADLADIVKMLNLKTGGSFQDGVNEAQKYLLEE